MGYAQASPELVAETLRSADALRTEASTDRASYGCNGNEVSNNRYVHGCDASAMTCHENDLDHRGLHAFR